MRKLFVYIATSLDGYIAAPHDNLDFLKQVEKQGEDYGYAAFTSGIDTIILGRKTYDWVSRAIGSEHYEKGERRVYVITSAEKPSAGNTHFYAGDLAELISGLKSENSEKHIYCDGGAQLIDALLRLDLIDELIISVVPVLLGAGTRLFKDGRAMQALELLSVRHFDTGLVQLHYERKKT